MSDIDWKLILLILIWNEQYADWTENSSWKVFHNLCESHDLSFLFKIKNNNFVFVSFFILRIMEMGIFVEAPCDLLEQNENAMYKHVKNALYKRMNSTTTDQGV